jgi:hypothetical protein
MKVLTSTEAEELVEHLASRPDIWTERKGVWVRMDAAQPLLALCIKPGLPNGLLALVHKPLGPWSAGAADDYVEWLLDKYTAYSLRQQVVKILAPAIKSTADIHALSQQICDIQGGTFRYKYVRAATVVERMVAHG